MRSALVIAAALSLALFLGSVAGGGESRGKATLKLAKGSPLTLRGTNFRPSERVRVSVKSELTRTKHVTANRSGVFSVGFGDAYDRCSGLIALAVGSRGTRAGLKMPMLGCPAP